MVYIKSPAGVAPISHRQGSQVLQDVGFDLSRVVHQAVTEDAQQQVVHENQQVAATDQPIPPG